MPRRVLIGCLAAFFILAAILWLPWLTDKRLVVASTPVPPALSAVTPAPLPPGSRACMGQVTMDPDSQVIETGINTGDKPGPPLVVTASGPGGYRATTRVPSGYPSTAQLLFNIDPPKRALLGTLCFRNAGKRAVKLNGTDEFRTLGRPALSIDGVAQPFDVQLKFYARKQASYLSRAGAIFDHASTFTPPFFGKTLLILLGLLALIAIPVVSFLALAIAAREDES